MADEIATLVKQDSFNKNDKNLIYEKVISIQIWSNQIRQQVEGSKNINEKTRGKN